MFEIEESSLRQEAVTKAKRQIILERFFIFHKHQLIYCTVSVFVMSQIARRNQRKNKDENQKKSSFRRRKSEVWDADSFTRGPHLFQFLHLSDLHLLTAEEVEGTKKFRRVMIGIQESVIHITSEGGLNLRKIFLHKMEVFKKLLTTNSRINLILFRKFTFSFHVIS